jgi:hypothetical protein
MGVARIDLARDLRRTLRAPRMGFRGRMYVVCVVWGLTLVALALAV